MKYKIGIYGSASDASKDAHDKAKEIGKALGMNGCIVITGATSGIAFEGAQAAYQNGGKVWGFSPSQNLEQHKVRIPEDDTDMYEKLFYLSDTVPFADVLEVGFKYRNVSSTATCDAGIIVSGRWGTLNEFTCLYDMGKVIGVLTGTGGVADEIQLLLQKIQKKSQAEVIFNDSPEKLVADILKILKERDI